MSLLPRLPRPDFHPRRSLIAFSALALGLATASAQPIAVPNASFESQVAPPSFPFITTLIDSWQKNPKPAWFDEDQIGIFWDQTAGLFQNPPPGQPNRIVNMDGNQGLYLLSFPGAGIFQDYLSTAWNQPTPSHDFDARFEAGQAYTLTAGVIGGLGGMAPGTSLSLSLYWRELPDEFNTVAETLITYSPELFPDPNLFVDFAVTLPHLEPTDTAVGRQIGIRISNASGTGQGYWDVDNVRLVAIPEPGSAALLTLGLAGLLLGRGARRPV